MKQKFYRVCNTQTKQGLWYDQQGHWTGLIHEDFKFCDNNALRMDFDLELVGWMSATECLSQLFMWFPEYDIKRLQSFGYFIHVYESENFKYYDRFKHMVIEQKSAVLLNTIIL